MVIQNLDVMAEQFIKGEQAGWFYDLGVSKLLVENMMKNLGQNGWKVF